MKAILVMLLSAGVILSSVFAVCLFMKMDKSMRLRGENPSIVIMRLIMFILWAFLGYLGPVYLGMRAMEQILPRPSLYEVALFGIVSICVLLTHRRLRRHSLSM